MKSTLFSVKKTVLVIALVTIIHTGKAATLKLTNKTPYTLTIEKLPLLGIPLFSQEKKIEFPIILESDESFFYDAGTAGFQSIEIAVRGKAHLQKTFNLNIAGIQTSNLWEIFMLQEDDSEEFILMGTGGILD